jgi:hypothetical protein
MNNIENRIKNDWFENHKADYRQVDPKEDIYILDWRNPKTGRYSLRYIMEGNFLYVSGDINSAVYDLTWKATLESFADISMHYFYEKLSAFPKSKIKFNPNIAKENLTERIDAHKELYYDEEPGYIEILKEIRELIPECSSHKQWEQLLIVDDLYDRLTEYDVDAAEWIFDIGNDIPNAIKAHFIGLQMVAKQLGIKTKYKL